jgi:hypothetical protein
LLKRRRKQNGAHTADEGNENSRKRRIRRNVAEPLKESGAALVRRVTTKGIVRQFAGVCDTFVTLHVVTPTRFYKDNCAFHIFARNRLSLGYFFVHRHHPAARFCLFRFIARLPFWFGTVKSRAREIVGKAIYGASHWVQ